MYTQNGALVRQKFLEHLIPTMLTTVALSMATVVDSIIVGNLLGAEALAVIGLTAPLIYCINVLYMLFGVGGMMSASIARGKWEMEKANGLFSSSLLAGLGVMLAFLLLVEVLLGPICSLLAAGDDVMAKLAAQYLRAMMLTAPALMISSGVALFMRAEGDPKGSAAVAIISNVVNLILDYVFIRFLNMGIMGAGLSTALGYVFGIFLVLPYLFNRNGKRSFRFVRPTLSCVREAVSTGIPKGCANIAPLLCSMVLNTLVLAVFGSLGMSVMTVLINVFTIVNIFVSGTGDTLLPIVGTLYGEGDVQGIRKAVGSARNVLTIACVLLVGFFLLFPQLIGRMFGLGSIEGLALLRPALAMYALYVPLYAAVTTIQNFYNTTGRKRFASVIPLLNGCAYVCAFALLLSQLAPRLLWLCYALSGAATFVTILVFCARIKKKEGVKGLLLLRQDCERDKVWDLTVNGTPDQAVDLSQKVMAFCEEQQFKPRMAYCIALAIEEMTLASLHYAYDDQPGPIDILIRQFEDNVQVRFRDNGKPFNPVDYVPENSDGLITDGIEEIKRMADDVQYSRQLGFNMTVLCFARVQSGR